MVTMGCLGQCREQHKDGEAVFKNTLGVPYDSSCLAGASVCGKCGVKMSLGRTCWKHSNCESHHCVNLNTWFSWLGEIGAAGCNGICEEKPASPVEIGISKKHNAHEGKVGTLESEGLTVRR